MYYASGLTGCHLSKAFQIIFVIVGTLPDLIYYLFVSIVATALCERGSCINEVALFIIFIPVKLCSGLVQLTVYFRDIKVNIEVLQNGGDDNMSQDYRQLVNPSQQIV